MSPPIPKCSLETWLASSKSRFLRLSLAARMVPPERNFEAYNLTNRFIASYSCEVVFSVDFWKRQLNWSIEGKIKERKCNRGFVRGFSSLERMLQTIAVSAFSQDKKNDFKSSYCLRQRSTYFSKLSHPVGQSFKITSGSVVKSEYHRLTNCSFLSLLLWK